MQLHEGRMIIFWLIGCFTMLGAVFMGSQATPTALGATTGGFLGSLVLTFILILITSVLWIAVASSLKD